MRKNYMKHISLGRKLQSEPEKQAELRNMSAKERGQEIQNVMISRIILEKR